MRFRSSKIRRPVRFVTLWGATALTLAFGEPTLAAGTNSWLTYRLSGGRRPTRRSGLPRQV